MPWADKNTLTLIPEIVQESDFSHCGTTYNSAYVSDVQSFEFDRKKVLCNNMSAKTL